MRCTACRFHGIDAKGGVPALSEVQFSLVRHRGCFGSCSFCAITSHQGRIIQNRSHESLIAEAERMIAMPDFKGYIHDVGGPTANFRHTACQKQGTKVLVRARIVRPHMPVKTLIPAMMIIWLYCVSYVNLMALKKFLCAPV